MQSAGSPVAVWHFRPHHREIAAQPTVFPHPSISAGLIAKPLLTLMQTCGCKKWGYESAELALVQRLGDHVRSFLSAMLLATLGSCACLQAQAYDGHPARDRDWATRAFQGQYEPNVKVHRRYRPAGQKHGVRHHYRAHRAPEVRSWVKHRPAPHHHHHNNAGNSRRDATGDVSCWPHVEAWSVEANTEEGAWRDAQRNWENQVRAMYGERFMDIGNAKEGGERQCWVSSGNQSVAGRVAETVGRVVGTDAVDGRKHRCRVMLRPCQAPKESNPQTKADKQ